MKIFKNYFWMFFIIFSRKFKKIPYFRIGYSYSDFELSMKKFRFIENPKNGYFADPFICRLNLQNYIFCEHYDFVSKKGIIEVIEITEEKQIKFLGPCIDENFHVSFPFIISTNFGVFMVPETRSENAIYLYKCVSWPMIWKKQLTLIQGIDACDSVIFFRDEKWWLMTTQAAWKGDSAQSELYIYYSDNLESSNWKAHRKNPVIINSYYGRNAGLVNINGDLYRCSQAKKKFIYGHELNFHKICILTIDNYEETLVKDMQQSYVHTYDSKSGMTVIDARINSSRHKKFLE